MSFCEFIKEIDFFGKEPEFYIKGKSKQVTLLGRIFTLFFIIIYIIIFCYKVFRMTQRVDITFYDSYSNTDEIPTIKITQENFTLVFSVLDEDGEPFIDDTIYYPTAFFSDEETEEINIEICDPDKINKEYKEFFQESEISNYYCLTDINYSLQPYLNSLRIEINPCENTDEDDDYCESREFIQEYLGDKLFMIYFQDIMLTPTDFNHPVRRRINYLNTEMYENIGQYLHTEMQIVKIETSTNIIGFDFLTEPKIEEFIKFDNEVILPFPGYNFEDEESTYPMTIFELQLNDKIMLEKRQYVQLIDVLGEIGGFIEIIYSSFTVISSLIVDILYEKKIANNLFAFNIKKKLILIKKQKNYTFKINKDQNVEEPNISEKNLFPNDKNKKKKKIIIVKTKKKIINNKNKGNNLALNKNILESNTTKKEIKDNFDIQPIKNSFENLNKNNVESSFNFTKLYKNYKDNGNSLIIEKINFKDLLFSNCYCCGGKRRKAYKILTNESMNIVTEKLDILNIFRNICAFEHVNNDLNNSNLNVIKMSEECSNDLLEIIK